MRIFLTGGSGFTGFHFINYAFTLGHTIFNYQADILENNKLLIKELNEFQPEWIVNFAAISHINYIDQSRIYDVNVIGTTNLLNAIIESNCKPNKVLLISSANIYGNCGLKPISEKQEPSPLNHYAMSKLAMELMSKNYMDNMPIIIARPFNYTGIKQDNSFLIPKIIDKFKKRSDFITLGNIDIVREFNDVNKICEIYFKLLELGVNGNTYNICSGISYTIQNILQMLRELTRHDLNIIINNDYIRKNELLFLVGNPTKLHSTIGEISHLPLIESLKTMLFNNE